MEIDSQHPIVISENTRTNITNLIKNIYHINVNTKFKKILISKQSHWLTIIIGTLGSLFIIGAFILGITDVLKTKADFKNSLLFTFLGIGIVLFLIASLINYGIRRIKKRIRFLINRKVLEYYQTVAHNNIDALKINNLVQSFTISPQNFVPEPRLNTKIYNEKVIIANFLNHDFNLGTLLEKIVINEGKNTRTVYNRYMYLTIIIPEYDYKTTIRPSSFFDKFTQRKEIKLESQEFEKMFTLDYHDPIKLRKLLSPKVMAKMLDYGTIEKVAEKLPHIFLNQSQVTLMIPFNSIGGPNSAKGDLIHFKVTNDINKTTEDIIAMIEHDLTKALTLIKWVQIMDLI